MTVCEEWGTLSNLLMYHTFVSELDCASGFCAVILLEGHIQGLSWVPRVKLHSVRISKLK